MSAYVALLCSVGAIGAAGACAGYVRGRAERREWGTDHHRARRRAEQAERDRLSGYDRKTGMYLKGGLRARNAPPEPTGHPRPPGPPPGSGWGGERK